MKPIASLAFLCAIIAFVSVALLTSAGAAVLAQDAFKDVPSGDWAYRAIADFQKNNILIGYPDGFFNGKRVLTRYEFALAIKRAVENAVTESAGQPVAPDEVQSFRRLVDEFSKDLVLLHVDVVKVKLRLDAIANNINSARRSDTTAIANTLPFQGLLSVPLRSVFTSESSFGVPLVLDDSALLNGFNLTTRIGSATTSLFANSYYGLTGFFTGDAVSRSSAGSVGAPLAITPPIPSNTILPPTQSGAVANKSTGLHVTVPLFNTGTIGGTLLDFSNLAAASTPASDIIVGGINFKFNPIGRMQVSGEASRSVAQLDPGADPDNSAFNLNLRYDAGPFGVLGGFQYVDPGYEAPGVWSRIGVLSNLTNVQGPFLRVNYTLNPRTQFEVGSDLLSGARNRSYNFGGGLTTGFGTHDFISTLSAGMQYKLWHSTSLTADWEGVYWDLSSASSGLGVEAHPFESYINLGTGINLRGNAMLKMGYQIGSFGNFSGFGGLGPSGSGQSYNAFTTELNVKF